MKLQELFNIQDNKNFNTWFAGSKVVNAQGEPLVVYHGTKDDIKHFDTRKSKINSAFFFTSNPQFASSPAYTGYIGGREKGGGNVMPVYLRVINPLVLDDEESFNPMVESGIIERAKQQGHDGVHIKKDGRWIVFDGSQIKSAIGNNGHFNIKRKNITERSNNIDLESSSNFKAWFTGSKIVNSDGTPKKVYHGTLRDFSEFIRRLPGKKDGLDSIGSWFTDNPKRASDYGHFIMPVYLSIKKPLVLDSFNELRDYWHDAQPRRGEAAKAHKANRHHGSSDAFRDEMDSLFDGIIIKMHGEGEWKDQTAYIAFHPNQIKSAISNNGQYSTTSNNITESKLMELGNSPFFISGPTEFSHNGKTVTKYSFYGVNDEKFNVYISKINEDWEVHFDKEGEDEDGWIKSINSINPGNTPAIRVFSSVLEVIKKEMSAATLTGLMFNNAAQSHLPKRILLMSRDDEASRLKLYKKFAQRIYQYLPKYEYAGQESNTELSTHSRTVYVVKLKEENMRYKDIMEGDFNSNARKYSGYGLGYGNAKKAKEYELKQELRHEDNAKQETVYFKDIPYDTAKAYRMRWYPTDKVWTTKFYNGQIPMEIKPWVWDYQKDSYVYTHPSMQAERDRVKGKAPEAPAEKAPETSPKGPGTSPDIKMTHLHYFNLTDEEAQEIMANGVKLRQDKNKKWYMPQYNVSGRKFQTDFDNLVKQKGQPRSVNLK